MDAVYSIVQMPPGIPVATVAIDGGMNAAILAAKMLAMSDRSFTSETESLFSRDERYGTGKSSKLAEVGYEEYLNNK